jgi:hypothetical protein
MNGHASHTSRTQKKLADAWQDGFDLRNGFLMLSGACAMDKIVLQIDVGNAVCRGSTRSRISASCSRWHRPANSVARVRHGPRRHVSAR